MVAPILTVIGVSVTIGHVPEEKLEVAKLPRMDVVQPGNLILGQR